LKLDDALDSILERFLRLRDLPKNGQEPFDAFLEDRDEDIVLVLEVEVDRAVRDTGRPFLAKTLIAALRMRARLSGALLRLGAGE